ncbi:MAG: SRPBCC family protein [Chloroflexi bacterium]|nr:SRPBCC family protein [Chloroflexota bacterium]
MIRIETNVDINRQVTAFERDKKLAFVGSGEGMAYTADMNFESTGGGTRVNYKFTVQVSGLMKLLEPLLAGQVRKEEEGELKKLKQLLEA